KFGGEMRGATTGGSSCTLSGTSQFASALLNWRKKRQVPSAARRRTASSSSVIAVFPASKGLFSHCDRGFAQAQRASTGDATGKAPGRYSARAAAITADSHGVQPR